MLILFRKHGVAKRKRLHSSSKTLLDLPDEVLRSILEYLPLTSIKNVRSTCSRLRQLSYSREIMKKHKFLMTSQSEINSLLELLIETDISYLNLEFMAIISFSYPFVPMFYKFLRFHGFKIITLTFKYCKLTPRLIEFMLIFSLSMKELSFVECEFDYNSEELLNSGPSHDSITIAALVHAITNGAYNADVRTPCRSTSSKISELDCEEDFTLEEEQRLLNHHSQLESFQIHSRLSFPRTIQIINKYAKNLKTLVINPYDLDSYDTRHRSESNIDFPNLQHFELSCFCTEIVLRNIDIEFLQRCHLTYLKLEKLSGHFVEQISPIISASQDTLVTLNLHIIGHARSESVRNFESISNIKFPKLEALRIYIQGYEELHRNWLGYSEFVSEILNDFDFPRLKALEIHASRYNAKEKDIKNIKAGCPCLEFLQIPSLVPKKETIFSLYTNLKNLRVAILFAKGTILGYIRPAQPLPTSWIQRSYNWGLVFGVSLALLFRYRSILFSNIFTREFNVV